VERAGVDRPVHSGPGQVGFEEQHAFRSGEPVGGLDADLDADERRHVVVHAEEVQRRVDDLQIAGADVVQAVEPLHVREHVRGIAAVDHRVEEQPVVQAVDELRR
jgi:hypothetical protein